MVNMQGYRKLKLKGWALNSEYFCSIMHALRDDSTYRTIVDRLVEIPAGSYIRDTEAVKRIATAYLKLLFPNVRKVSDISARDFKYYCLRPAIKMREIVRIQQAHIDKEYKGKEIPAFEVVANDGD